VTEITCVVFDIDDTLYLERDYVRSGFRHVDEWVGRTLGIEGFADRAWGAFERGVRGSIFDEVLQGCGVDSDPGLVDQLVEVYRTHSPDIQLTSDARDCLENLLGRVTLMSVTDGPVQSQRSKASALGLAQWIDPILLTEELGTGFGKPHPRAFELVQQLSETSGPACAYVADTPATDYSGPNSLGWRTLRVRRPEGLHAGRESGGDVDVEVPDLAGADTVMERLAGDRLRHSP
jgi:putative hydrolase of the HAD superfamily